MVRSAKAIGAQLSIHQRVQKLMAISLAIITVKSIRIFRIVKIFRTIKLITLVKVTRFVQIVRAAESMPSIPVPPGDLSGKDDGWWKRLA